MALLSLALSGAPTHAVTFAWAAVGNPGNVGELSGVGAGGVGPDAIVGAVSYNYAISKHAVTNGQYAEFLNAVAKDGFRPPLYNTNMGSDAYGGIIRSGAPGSYTYATKANMADKPVNYVSFFDAMRFTNWLHNGQGLGDTETGAYTMHLDRIEVRSANAKFWVPSEDERYKAAYHDASAGTAGVYFDYATGSDCVPTIATSNSVGDISNPGVGVVNYLRGADWNGRNGNMTTVGSAGPDSTSPYGTFDQSGNIWEWNEADDNAVLFGLRGGSWANRSDDLRANFRSNFVFPADEFSYVGFRVATVPEPSTMFLGVLAGIGLLLLKRR